MLGNNHSTFLRVKFSSVISIQNFSVKNANPSFYEIHVKNDYFPLPSKFEMQQLIWLIDYWSVHKFEEFLTWMETKHLEILILFLQTVQVFYNTVEEAIEQSLNKVATLYSIPTNIASVSNL
jgi:hypothetical protein